MNTRQRIGLLLLCLAGGLLLARAKGCDVVGPSKPTLAVILYEADHGELPPYVWGAVNELTAAGFDVRPIDDDTTTGLDKPPVWLAPALEQGRAIMGGTNGKDDALVLLAGDRVLSAVKLPESKEAIVEAVR